MSERLLIANLFYDPYSQTENGEFVVETTEDGRAALSMMTDFELKVLATAYGIIVRRTLELPPSPHPAPVSAEKEEGKR